MPVVSPKLPVRLIAPIVVVALAALGANLRGLGFGLLLLAAGALLLIITLIWNSVQALGDEQEASLEEALELGAPSAAEEQKRAALRALKDLEYERSVGKISEDDYKALSDRYRAEARALLQAADAENAPLRARVEKLVAARLAKAGIVPAATTASSTTTKAAASTAEADDDNDNDDEPDDAATSAKSARTPTRRCAACETRNDLDASFCKKCGAKMADDGKKLCGACPAVFDATLSACPDCGVEGSAP